MGTINSFFDISLSNNMIQEFIRLSESVPSNSQSYLRLNSESLSSMRERLMLRHRQIFLSRFHSRFITANYFPQRDTETFLRMIAADPSCTNDPIPPLQGQFILKLIEHFQWNPTDLLNVSLNAYRIMKAVKYDFFATSTISSVFGFYSCAEHLMMARPFLREIVKQPNKNFVGMTLRPFFCNPTTSRFVERVRSYLEQTFCLDLVVAESWRDVRGVLQRHVNPFADFIFDSLASMPEPHLEVLRLLSEHSWSESSVFELFVDKFLRPQLKRYFRASGFAQFLEQVLDLVKLLRRTPGDVRRLFKVRSLLVIPSLFVDFDLPYVFFLVSPRDGQLLFKYSQKVVTFPKVLLMTSRENFLKGQGLVPVWLKRYRCCPQQQPSTHGVVFNELPLPEFDVPHFEKRWLTLKKLGKEKLCHPMDILDGRVPLRNIHLGPEAAADRHLQDKNCPAAEGIGCDDCTASHGSFVDFALRKSVAELKMHACCFETFIRYCAALNPLSEFDDLSLNLWDTILVEFCDTLNQGNDRDLKTIMDIFKTPHTKKKVFIKWMYKKLTRELLSKWADLSKLLEIEWLRVLEDGKCSEKAGQESNMRQIVAQLKALPKVAQEQQYFVLIACLKELYALTQMRKPNDGLVALVLKKANAPGLIQVLLFASCLLMKNNDFQQLCSREELHAWFGFEKGFLELVEGHEKLSQVYSIFQDEVLVEFAR
jgi:hypothetical protein